jgi:hypothetical protein
MTMMIPHAGSQLMAPQLTAFDPSRTPAGKMLAWWRAHEDVIVLTLIVGGGLFAVASVFAIWKAAPLAAKAAPHLVKFAATKYPLLAAV